MTVEVNTLWTPFIEFDSLEIMHKFLKDIISQAEKAGSGPFTFHLDDQEGLRIGVQNLKEAAENDSNIVRSADDCHREHFEARN